MRIIVGLGNPGDKHRHQRHNVGFMAADAIAARHNFPPFREKFSGLVSEGTIDGEKVMILKPQTFMNRSGDSVAAAVGFYKVEPSDVTVIYDEIDLTPGKVRVKVGGSNGGHNGLRSIDPRIGLNYRRIRIGVGHPGHKDRVVSHVLNDFTKADHTDWLDRVLNALAENAGLIVRGDDNGLMNKLAIALQTETPKPAAPASAPTSQSHIRAARRSAPQTEVPHTGPMAAILAKVFGKKPGA